jgi:hypothetical protein
MKDQTGDSMMIAEKDVRMAGRWEPSLDHVQ